MKANSTQVHVLLVSVFVTLLVWCSNIQAQSRTFTYEVKNDSVIDATHFRFTVWLSATSGVDSFRTAQFSLWISSAFINGTGSVAYMPGTTDINPVGSFSTSIVTPTAGGTPPGTGGDTLNIHINTTSNACPGYILTTTAIRLGEFEITRTGAGTWGCSANKLGFYSDIISTGNKIKSNIVVWTSCSPSTNFEIPTSSGTYLTNHLNNQTPVISAQPNPTTVCSNNVTTFSVMAGPSTIDPGTTAPLTYQWLENGISLGAGTGVYSNAQTNTLTLTSPPANLSGNIYSCVVTQCGSVTSTGASLTVNTTTSSSTSISACYSYVWNGTTYTTSGTKSFDAGSTSNSQNCDSVAFLVLTINHSNTSATSVTTCDPYAWNGNTYTTSGTYTYHTTNAAGCDSMASLILYNNCYIYEIKGDSVDNCSDFYFSIWVSAGSRTIPFRSAQFALWMSNAFVNGTVAATGGVTYVSGTSDISPTNIFGTPNFGAPSSGGVPPGTGGDTSVIKINTTANSCPGYTLTTTPVRLGQFKVTRSGAGCWTCSQNKLGFYTGLPLGNKIQSNMNVWATCPSNVTLPIVNGTYVNSNLNNQSPVITLQPQPASACTNGAPAFSVTAVSVNSGSTATITYQWLENGSPLSNVAPYSGVTTTTLTITSPSLGLNGKTYSCVVTQCGSVTSAGVVLTVKANSTGSSSATSCNSYVWNSATYTTGGDKTYLVVGGGANGCDSIATLHLTINVTTSGSQFTTACESYIWNGTTYTTSGEQTHLFFSGNAGGCDSLATLHLTINASSSGSQSTTSCDSYGWNGSTYITGGDKTHLFPNGNAGGCDSLATLHLTINHSSTSSSSATACDSYVWNGTTYTTGGTKTFDVGSTSNSAGCDSVAILLLTINHSTTSGTSVTACDSYVWNGTTYTTNGTKSFDAGATSNSQQCDSVAFLVLSVRYSSTSSTSVTACDSYAWNGTTYTTNGTKSFDAGATSNSQNCDSVAFLVLTLKHSSTSTSSATACDSYMWNGATYTTGGTKTFDAGASSNSVGCDSVASLILTINHSSTSTSSVTACDRFIWNGTTYTTNGTKSFDAGATSNSQNCDSVAFLVLTINHSSTSTTSVTTCDPYAWNGNTYTTSGTYTYHTTNAAGCDSTASLVLFNNCYIYEVKGDSVANCTDFYFTIWVSANSRTIPFRSAQFTLWMSNAFVNGTVAATGGVTYVSGTSDISPTNIFGTPNFGAPSSGGVPSGTGGDSSVIKINTTANSCPGYTLTTTPVRLGQFKVTRSGAGCWTCSQNKLGFYTGLPLGNKIQSNMNVWTTCPNNVTLPIVNGTCINSNLNNQTPVITVQPQVTSACSNGSTAFSVTATNLNPGSSAAITYQWLENGSPLSNVAPYSGVATSTLTITNPSLTLNGKTYSCVVTQCGSVTSTGAVLTVKSSSSSSSSATSCNSYVWNGATYTTSGDKTHLFIGGSANGCDSLATLHLTINISSSGSQSTTTCDSYIWTGATYTTSGDKTHLFPNGNAGGCDSLAILHLTINHSSTSSTSATACDSFVWNGATYTTGGTKTFDAGASSNSVGCDSVASLILTINHSSTSTSSVTACDRFIWNGTTYTTNGTKSFDAGATSNSQNCDSVAFLVLTINHSSISTTSVTTCDPYAWNGNIYTTSGTYTYHTTNASGCDSTASLILFNNCYIYEVRGDSVANCTDFYFTVWVSANSRTIPFRSAQFTLWMSNAFVNGTVAATGGVTYVSGTSDISPTNIFGAPNFGAPSSGGVPPGTGGDTSVIKINTTANTCPGYTLTTTPVRLGQFKVTRSGAGCWTCSQNKLGFYTGLPLGSKIQSNMNVRTTCPNNVTLPIINGTYVNSNLNNQTPVITVQPQPASACSNGAPAFSVSATNLNPGSSAAITYQWLENGSPLSNVAPYNGVTTSILTITNPFLSLNGKTYSCVVTQCGSVTSAGAVLIVKANSTGSSSATSCNSYVWNSATYTTGGDKTHLFVGGSANGCDSIATLHLTINNSSTSGTSVTNCVSYAWNGTTYTTSGTKTFLTTNAAGCDSLASLLLTIKASTSGAQSATSCNSYVWNGITYTTSGDKTHLFAGGNLAGCDSLATLHLTITLSSSGSETTSICESYVWNGGTFTSSGDHTFLFVGGNAAGCDSLATLHLTITGPCSAALTLKLFVQGYYNDQGFNSGTPMDNFGQGGCLYISFVSVDPTESDTVNVDLMDPGTQSSDPVATVVGILHTDGTVWQDGFNYVSLPGTALGNSYYIRIRHRNAIETWSADPILITQTLSYDFSLSADAAFGSNMTWVDNIDGQNIYAFWSGDVYDAGNGFPYAQDGVVESGDYGQIEVDYQAFLFGYYTTDVTGDGVVESADYGLIETNYQSFIFKATPW